jgi:hypothetical protein
MSGGSCASGQCGMAMASPQYSMMSGASCANGQCGVEMMAPQQYAVPRVVSYPIQEYAYVEPSVQYYAESPAPVRYVTWRVYHTPVRVARWGW